MSKRKGKTKWVPVLRAWIVYRDGGYRWFWHSLPYDPRFDDDPNFEPDERWRDPSCGDKHLNLRETLHCIKGFSSYASACRYRKDRTWRPLREVRES